MGTLYRVLRRECKYHQIILRTGVKRNRFGLDGRAKTSLFRVRNFANAITVTEYSRIFGLRCSRPLETALSNPRKPENQKFRKCHNAKIALCTKTDAVTPYFHHANHRTCGLRLRPAQTLAPDFMRSN